MAGVDGVVDAEYPRQAELGLVPFLPENGAVDVQRAVKPAGLPAHFVIGQRIGLIGRNDLPLSEGDGVAIVAAWAESRGVDGVQHLRRIELPLQLELVGFARLVIGLVEVGAADDGGGGRAAQYARR